MSGFSEASIRAGATGQSYERGVGYFRSGAVTGLVSRGNVLTADVEGSSYDDYRVVVTLSDAGAIEDATCTCPYDWGGYCKHIVAVLLAALRHESSIAVKPDLDTLLAGLTEKQLRRVVHALAAGRPELVADIEREVQWLTQEPVTTAPASPVVHSIAVDLAAVRRAIRNELRLMETGGGGRGGYNDYWDDEAGTIYPDDVLGPHQMLAKQLLDAGDPATAASVITAMIEQWGEGISDLDEWIFEANVDTFNEAAQGISLLLAEALLSMDLAPDERDRWLAHAEDWEDSAFDLEILETALDQWWDYPPLVAAMQGNITEQGAWQGEAPYFAGELTLARLRILERQGRTQEYIHLAEAEGQTGLYVNMLARSGQVERAVVEAQQTIQEPGEMLSLAQVLVAQGERAAALLVAEHGLSLKGHAGHATELARWTVAQAQQAGDAPLALRAAQAAFLSSFALADYQIAESLAGVRWPVVKADLLAAMEQSRPFGKIDIYLYEKMLVEAMAAIDRSPYGAELVQVIEATRGEYPDWGIRHCKRQAESIMDAKKAKDYDRAVEWLRIARDIYRQHHRDAEWQAYLRSLLAIHERKYKLVPMLRAIMT